MWLKCGGGCFFHTCLLGVLDSSCPPPPLPTQGAGKAAIPGDVAERTAERAAVETLSLLCIALGV